MLSLSVLALSSRFDGPAVIEVQGTPVAVFQYSLCRVVLMVLVMRLQKLRPLSFSTRSVESF